jgi:hypothetical protein
MEELRLILENMDDFFNGKVCVVTGQKLICPNVKILCALKQLAYGISPHAFLDYFQMGVNLPCLFNEFCSMYHSER